jgi:molecular chaperone GrpE
MSEKKIVMPTQDEVTEYAGQPAEKPQANAPGGTPPAADTGATQQAPAEQMRSEADEYKDKYLRAVAELSNYRKRSEKEREDAVRFANSGLVRSLLNVLDNLERVLASSTEHPENTTAIVDGVKMTADSFRKVLREHNVEKIEAHEQPFDPSVHEAIMQQPSDRHELPTVLQVVQEGYRLHDRVIRPARVIVSAPKEEGKA